MSPRLLFFINDIDYFMLHWLSRAQAALKAGYEVHIAASSLVGDRNRIEKEGFFFYPLPLNRRGTNIISELRCLVSVFSLFRRLAPQLVHNITIKPVIYGGIAARLAGVPAVVSTIPGLGYMFVKDGSVSNRFLRLLVRACYRLALSNNNSRVIFENGDDRNELICAGIVTPAKSLVIKGAGVDMAAFSPGEEPGGIPLVILAARMIWSKGVGEFVEASQYLHAEGVSARFVLIGESDMGNPAAIPTEQLQQWHDLGAVEWWGQRSDMPDVLAAASVVCLPTSYREGVPRILIEAAACGKPIVASDAPGCRDIVRNGVNGILVPTRDVLGLARALRTLIEDPSLRRTMGANGRRLAVEEFSEQRVLRETLAVYQKLIMQQVAGSSVDENPKQLLYLVAEDWYFCSHRLDLAREAKRRGYEVTVATRVVSRASCISEEGFLLVPLNISRKSLNPIRELLTLFRVISVFRRIKPDIVHTVGIKPVLYGGFAAVWTAVPAVVHALAGLGYIFSSDRFLIRIIRRLVLACFRYLFGRGGTRVIFQNDDDQRLMVSKGIVSPKVSSVIRGSGVDINIYVPLPEQAGIVTVILACRMLWDKGVEIFYSAAKLLRERGVQARFVLVGESDSGSMASIPQSQLIAWNDSGIVEWWGYRKDMFEVFAAGHIICLPSVYGEGVPKVLIEAAACTRPVIASDMPGCRDVVRNGENGFLVAPQDSESLADAIQVLILDPQLRQRMGANGRKLVEKEFSLDRIIAETLTVYAGEL